MERWLRLRARRQRVGSPTAFYGVLMLTQGKGWLQLNPGQWVTLLTQTPAHH